MSPVSGEHNLSPATESLSPVSKGLSPSGTEDLSTKSAGTGDSGDNGDKSSVYMDK